MKSISNPSCRYIYYTRKVDAPWNTIFVMDSDLLRHRVINSGYWDDYSNRQSFKEDLNLVRDEYSNYKILGGVRFIG